MHETTYDMYNKLMNHLFDVANTYYAIAISAMVAGLDGMSHFALNESHERWHYGHKIAELIMLHDGRPDITVREAPRQEYANPLDALTVMKKCEAETISLLNEHAMIAVESDPLALEKMGKWRRKLMKERNEIFGVDMMFKKAGATVASMDEELREKYECMVKVECVRHKY